MKISIINGSARKSGATAKILHEIQRLLLKKGDVDVTYIDLAQSGMELCKGCIQCYKTGRCIIARDGLEAVIGQVKQSDGIIIGSPVYESNVSGVLKNFMDRGHFLMDQSLHNKVGFVVTTYEIADGNVVRDMLRKFFAVAGAMVRGEFVLKLDFNGDPWAKAESQPRLQRQMEKFYQAIRRGEQKSLSERFFSHLLLQIIWKPIFLSQPQKYRAALDSWREKGLLTSEDISPLSSVIRAFL